MRNIYIITIDIAALFNKAIIHFMCSLLYCHLQNNSYCFIEKIPQPLTDLRHAGDLHMYDVSF